MAPAFGIFKFGFEDPAASALIDQSRRILLTCGSHHLETYAEQYLLLPFHVFLHQHGRTAVEVHGEPKG